MENLPETYVKEDDKRRDQGNVSMCSDASNETKLKTGYTLRKRKRTVSGLHNKKSSKVRTPSGTILTNTVKDIRNFFTFGPNGNRIQSTGTFKGTKSVVSSQIKKVKGRSIKAHSGVNAVTWEAKQKLINRSRRLQRRKHQNKTSIEQQQSDEENYTSDFTDVSGVGSSTEFATPDSEVSEVTGDEDMMIKLIAANMKEVTPEQLNQKLSAHIQRLKEMPSQPVQNTQSDAEKQKDNINREDNCDDNPKLMAVSTVIHMFKQVQEEVKQLSRSSKEQITEEMRSLKSGMEAEINQLDHFSSTENISHMQAELQHYKHKTEVLTDVVQRMNSEIQDLTQRLDSTELSNSKKICYGLWASTLYKQDGELECSELSVSYKLTVTGHD